MKSHELGRYLLEGGDVPISCTVEIATQVFDEFGDEIVVSLEGYELLELLTVGTYHNRCQEQVLHFTESGVREGQIDIRSVIAATLREEQP